MPDPEPTSPVLALPNLVTYARILAVPVVCLLVVSGIPALRWLGFVLYIAAAASDWVDGYLARRMNLVSPLGRMLDPIADKLLVGALIVVLAWDRSLSGLDLVPALAILMREMLVPGLREFLGPLNVTVHVTPLAKWKTTVQLVALGFIIAAPLVPGIALVAILLLWIAAILTVWSGYQYFAGSWRYLVGPLE